MYYNRFQSLFWNLYFANNEIIKENSRFSGRVLPLIDRQLSKCLFRSRYCSRRSDYGSLEGTISIQTIHNQIKSINTSIESTIQTLFYRRIHMVENVCWYKRKKESWHSQRRLHWTCRQIVKRRTYFVCEQLLYKLPNF